MSKDNLTLSECTKADLLWIIKYLTRFGGGSDDYYLKRALNQLWYEKEKQRIDEANKYAKLADAKRREYIELLSPYNGQPLISIPTKVLNRADKLMKEARDADQRRLQGPVQSRILASEDPHRETGCHGQEVRKQRVEFYPQLFHLVVEVAARGYEKLSKDLKKEGTDRKRGAGGLRDENRSETDH